MVGLKWGAPRSGCLLANVPGFVTERERLRKKERKKDLM